MRDRVAICFDLITRPRVLRAALVFLAACVASCTDQVRNDPAEIFKTTLALAGDRPAVVSRALQRGVYLVEAREREIDARVTVVGAGTESTLEDRLPRHGVAYKVVSLPAQGDLRIEVASADHRTKRGTIEVRILRWARDVAAAPGELEAGFVAQSVAGELAATGKAEAAALAADKLHEAISHFDSEGDDPARGQAAYSLAYLEYGPRDQFAASVRACEAAAEAFADADDEVGVQNAATMRAAAEIELASRMKPDTQRAEQRAMFAAADKRLARAAEFFATRTLRVRAGYAVNMRGVLANAVGDYDKAATLFTEAVGMARTNDDVREQAQSLANLAAVHNYIGHMAQAAQEYEALLPLIDRTAQPYQYANALGNYGFIMIALGDFDRALELHVAARDIYERINEQDERAVELAALGGLYFRMGDAGLALTTLESAIVEQELVKDTVGLAGTLRVAGNAAAALDRHELAFAYLRRSASIDANPHSVARTGVLIAGELRSLGKLDDAEKELAEPLRSRNALVSASALEERARIRLSRNDTRAAVADLRSADQGYAKLGLEINRIETSATLAQALLGLGDLRGATTAADEAIAIVSRFRVKSVNPEWRARFLSSRYLPYEVRIATDFAAGGADAAWRAFRSAEEVRARSLADEIEVGKDGTLRAPDPEEAELRARLTSLQLRLESRVHRQDAEESGTFSLGRAIAETRARIESIRARNGVAVSQISLPDSLQRVQSGLPEGTAVLAYFVGDGGSHAWLLTRTGLRHAALPDRRSLEAAILAAREEERAGTLGPANRKLGAMLLGQLLDGVDATRILLLADGPLNSVPFAALSLSGRNGELLVDRYVIANAPSLALAMSRPAHARSRNTRVAVISDPVYAPDDRRLRVAMEGGGTNLRGPAAPSNNNLTRLPFSALEASAVVKAIGAADTIRLDGFEAIPERVLELPARELAVLHFATHAVARTDQPEQSALFLTEYARDGSLLPGNRVTASDIARSGLRADVVVLSGCATGDGSALRGEGVLGLTYGFLANGSQSVVASLWPIEDASTARFMSEFYRDYRVSGRAADALRTAQLRVRASGKSGVWSGFVVRANEFP